MIQGQPTDGAYEPFEHHVVVYAVRPSHRAEFTTLIRHALQGVEHVTSGGISGAGPWKLDATDEKLIDGLGVAHGDGLVKEMEAAFLGWNGARMLVGGQPYPRPDDDDHAATKAHYGDIDVYSGWAA